MAYRLGQAQGQVTVNTGGLGLADGALQVEQTRAVGAGMPLSLPLALQVGVAQLQGPLRDIPQAVFLLPAGLGVQTLNGHTRVLQNARQQNGCTLFHVELDIATSLVHLELHLCALQAWPACLMGGQVQLAHLGLRIVALRMLPRADPLPFQGIDLAADVLCL